MAIFKAGQLVVLAWEDSTQLYSVPSDIKDVRVIGWLEKRDVALVVTADRSDGSRVYVVGPHGGGWTFGALLKILVEAPK